MSEDQNVVATEPAVPAGPPKRWYVVHAYSGMEKAVERNLRERIERAGMHDK
ncbi:MAG: transcription termination/antitermination protein NusG, partial [Proteobacteria bacterium]